MLSGTVREGDVVIEAHRAEHGAVLEQDAEQLADRVQVLLGAGGDVQAFDGDAALVRLEEADDGLEQNRLAHSRGAGHDADFTCRDGQRDTCPDEVLAKGLAQILDLDFDAHRFKRLPSCPWPGPSETSQGRANLPSVTNE